MRYQPPPWHPFAEVMWILANGALAVAALALLFYVAWVFLLTKWKTYPAGRAVLGFVTSLLGVVAIVIYGLFDSEQFLDYPNPPAPDPQLLRVVLRLVIYGLVAVATVRLDVAIVAAWVKVTRDRSQAVDVFFPPERTDQIRRLHRRR